MTCRRIAHLFLSLCLPFSFCWVDAEADDTQPIPARLLGYGDRIAIVGNSIADQLRRYGYLETELKRRAPEGELTVRNLGWAGDALEKRARPENFESEAASLREFGVDVIIACFGIGESFAGPEGVSPFRANLTTLINEYQSNQYNGYSVPRVILVTPLAFENLGKPMPDGEAQNLNLAVYATAMKEVAQENGLLCIDLFSPTLALSQEGGASKMTTNGVILSPYGAWVSSHFIADGLAPGYSGLEIALGGIEPVVANGANIEAAKARSNQAYSWNQSEARWKTPPPQDSSLHPSLRRWTDRLRATGLDEGVYALTVNGREIARATSSKWNEGLALKNLSEQSQVEAFRKGIVEKNDQFFLSWRSLNQVHIVGTRRKSPSGRALPGELKQFRANAEVGERELAKYPEFDETSRWEFRKVVD